MKYPGQDSQYWQPDMMKEEKGIFILVPGLRRGDERRKRGDATREVTGKIPSKAQVESSERAWG